MFIIVRLFLSSLKDFLGSRAALHAKALALRHQLLVLQRSQQGRCLRLQASDRIFWVWLSHLWKNWNSALRIVLPATIASWNRKGFRLYWRWKSLAQKGRPRTRRWAISARVTFSESESSNLPLIFARRTRFSSAKYSFLSNSSWSTVPVMNANMRAQIIPWPFAFS